MTNTCSNCDSLQRQLDQAQRELTEVKKELAIAKHTLGRIYSYCDSRARNNTSEMKGRVAKGRWEFLKGELETSNKILEIMGQHSYAVEKKSKGKSMTSAFSGVFRGIRW